MSLSRCCRYCEQIFQPSINLDGSGINQSFITGAGGGAALTVDGRFIYWIVGTGIARANLDGSGVDKSFIGANQPSGVAVDGLHVYWSNNGGGIRSADC